MGFAEMASLAFPRTMLAVFIVCLILDAIGFYKFVYFLSVGYGFAVTGTGLTILCLYGGKLTWVGIVLCILFIIYGIRLGGFLLYREIKSAAYRKTLKAATHEDKPIPVFVKLCIWLCVAVLYVMQTSPVLYRAANGDKGGVAGIVAICVMICALIIESTADKQKSAAKKVNPKRFCDTGLYKMVRCPNYFGEILFWTGVLISGFGVFQGALQWIVALLGYVLIVYIMFSGAKRLEIRQNKNYGSDPEYRKYSNSTPIIIPLIPLYHVENVKFIKA